MLLKLKEIEPFNIPPVEDTQAAKFMNHLTGSEEFAFEGDTKPSSILLYDLKYNYPGHCIAHGFLLSIDVDTFLTICDSDKYTTMEPILKRYLIGRINIRFGGDLKDVLITAGNLSL